MIKKRRRLFGQTKSKIITSILLFSIAATACSQVDKGEYSYLNQDPPGLTPQIFAPGIISTEDEYEFGSVFSKNADAFYYAVRLDTNWNAEIRYSKLQEGQWTIPTRFPLDKEYSYNDPFLSRDGNRLYFMSNRAEDGGNPKEDSDLWYIKRTDEGWSEPINLGSPVNTDKNEYYISFADDGTLYYASNVHTSKADESNHDIYFAEYKDGVFQTPNRLGEAINSEYFEVDAFVSPDESYLIFCSTRPDGYGEGDLYISFKEDDGTWSEAVNMGAAINSEHHEFCPFVTKDGKYFFYTSNGDIYWVSAEIIENIQKDP